MCALAYSQSQHSDSTSSERYSVLVSRLCEVVAMRAGEMPLPTLAHLASALVELGLRHSCSTCSLLPGKCYKSCQRVPPWIESPPERQRKVSEKFQKSVQTSCSTICIDSHLFLWTFVWTSDDPEAWERPKVTIKIVCAPSNPHTVLRKFNSDRCRAWIMLLKLVWHVSQTLC